MNPSAGMIEPGVSCMISPTFMSSGCLFTYFLSLKTVFYLHDRSLSLRRLILVSLIYSKYILHNTRKNVEMKMFVPE